MRTDFEAWAAEQRKILGTDAKPAPVVAPLLEDATARWKREADEATEQRAYARVRRRARALRMRQRAHAAANNNNNSNGDGVDWAAVLSSIADALNTINQRLITLEARAGINNSSELTTELLDLPRFLAPRYGPGAGWPLEAGIRFSQPLMTKQKAK